MQKIRFLFQLNILETLINDVLLGNMMNKEQGYW
jgi:hypothetical protein